MSRSSVVAVALSAASVLLLASCAEDRAAAVTTGSPVEQPADATEPAAEMPDGASSDRCDPSVPDCADTSEVADDDVAQEQVDPEPGTDPQQARADAQYLLGLPESDLAEHDVRISRRGDEQFPMIEDYVVGRRTVELDEIDGVFVVVSVTVELPDGPETFTA